MPTQFETSPRALQALERLQAAKAEPQEFDDGPDLQSDPNVALDVLKAPFRGVTGAVGSVYSLADYFTGDSLPDWENPFGTSQTTAGSVVEGITEFATGFIPIFGQLGKVGSIARAIKAGSKVAKAGQSIAAGAAADFLVFDGHEERLSDLVQKFPGLQKPIFEYLASNENDSELEGRFKNVLEGLGAGAVAGAFMKTLKGLKKARFLKELGESEETAIEEFTKEFGSKDELQSLLPEISKSKPELPVKDQVQNYLDTGDFNPSVWQGPEDIKEFLEKSWKATQAAGEGSGRESWKELGKSAEEVSNAILGTNVSDVSELFKDSIRDVDKARSLGRVAASMMVDMGTKSQEALKVAADSGKKTDMARALKTLEQFTDLIVINRNYSRTSGQLLASRKKYFHIAELSNAEAVEDIISKYGGDKHLKKQMAKLAVASDPSQLGKLVRKSITQKGKLLRIHNEYFINSILSGPKTHVVNTLGNTLNTTFLPFERALGAAVRGDITGARSSLSQYSYLAGSIIDGFRVAMKAFKEGDNNLFRDAAVSDVVSKGAIPEVAPSALKGVFSKIWDGFGTAMRMPTRALMTSDEFFKYINYRSASKSKLLDEALRFNQTAAEGDKIKNVPEWIEDRFSQLITDSGEARSEGALIRQAIRDNKDKVGLAQAQAIKADVDAKLAESSRESGLKEFLGSESFLNEAAAFGRSIAEESTFTTPLREGIAKDTQNFIRRHPFFQIIVPFFRTPTNILKFVGQRTFPVVSMGGIQTPILGRLHKRAVEDLTSGDPLKVAAAEGRLFTGMGFIATAGLMVDNGVITGGGPTNTAERKVWLDAGNQPYSVKVGDIHVSYNRLDPFGIFLGLVADWYEVESRSEEHLKNPNYSVMSSMAVALSNNITSRSYLQGLSNFFDALGDPAGSIPGLGKQHLAALVPNLFGQTSGLFTEDDAMKEVRGLFDGMKRKLPGQAEDLEPVRNILGEKVTNINHRGANWINPMAISTTKDDPVLAEIASLQHGFSKPSALLYGQINLVGEEAIHPESGQSAYDRLLELRSETRIQGKTLRRSLERLFKSRDYRQLQDLPGDSPFDDPRTREVNKVIRRYSKVAEEQLLREYPELAKKARLFKVNQGRIRKGLSILQEL